MMISLYKRVDFKHAELCGFNRLSHEAGGVVGGGRSGGGWKGNFGLKANE